MAFDDERFNARLDEIKGRGCTARSASDYDNLSFFHKIGFSDPDKSAVVYCVELASGNLFAPDAPPKPPERDSREISLVTLVF